jgi:hypothetical protein
MNCADTLILLLFSFFLCLNVPLVAEGVLIVKASQSYSDTSYPIGHLWISDQPIAETST